MPLPWESHREPQRWEDLPRCVLIQDVRTLMADDREHAGPADARPWLRLVAFALSQGAAHFASVAVPAVWTEALAYAYSIQGFATRVGDAYSNDMRMLTVWLPRKRA